MLSGEQRKLLSHLGDQIEIALRAGLHGAVGLLLTFQLAIAEKGTTKKADDQ